jgi:RHS repeat-associated protein
LFITYDANGNTLSDRSGKQYTWDFENRLTQVVNPGVGTTTFRYDPFGRRIQKSGPLGTTNYLYDGSNSTEEVDSSGNVLARYALGQQIDEALAQTRSGTTAYYEADNLGSVTSLSTSTGVLANTYAYDSFGKLTTSTGTTVNPLQYTGRAFDSEIGIYFYRARYYDQNAGRFLREDPLRGISGSVNFYAYVDNSPINLVDPSGLCPCDKTRSFRLVPISDALTDLPVVFFTNYGGRARITGGLTEHQNPPSWAPPANGSPAGQSTGDENNGPGGFDDGIFGWGIGNSYQNFTISPDDPRKVPNTPSCPVDVQLPSGPNGQPQDYRTLGLWHGNPQFINGNSTGWVPCNSSYQPSGYH